MTNHLKPFEGDVINQTLDKLPGLQTPVNPPLLFMTLVPKGHPMTVDYSIIGEDFITGNLTERGA